MIKFFRKIRQRLISENRAARYLLYALGEIVLVVIGILIALQINNANEHRKAIAVSDATLRDLDREMEGAVLQLEQMCPVSGSGANFDDTVRRRVSDCLQCLCRWYAPRIRPPQWQHSSIEKVSQWKKICAFSVAEK